MNKEQLHLLPESCRKGRDFVYTSTHAQQAVVGPPPAYHSVQVSAPTCEQPTCSRVVIAAFITLLCCICIWPASPFALMALAYAFKADAASENRQEQRAKVAINRSATCATIAFVIGASVIATTTAYALYLHYYH